MPWSWGNCEATIIATRKATNMATPPPLGVTRVWIRRSSGSSTKPSRTASTRRGNMTTYVPTAATAATTAYAPRGGTPSGPSTAGTGDRPQAGQRGIRGEPVTQSTHRVAHPGQDLGVCPPAQADAHQG